MIEHLFIVKIIWFRLVFSHPHLQLYGGNVEFGEGQPEWKVFQKSYLSFA